MAFGSAELIKATAGWDKTRKRTATVILQVLTDDADDGPFSAMLAPGVPLLYDTYDIGNETDSLLYCIEKSAERIHDDLAAKWWVTLNYSTLTAKEKKRLDNPLSRPADISSSHRQISTIVERDINGVLVTNSAGYVFNPPKEREDSRKILRLTQNFAAYNGGFAFINRVNNSTFLGAAAGTLKCSVFDEEREIEEFESAGVIVVYVFWRRTVELEYKPDGWQKELLDIGTMDNTGTRLTDPTTGALTDEPLKLDGNGQLLTPQTAAESYENYDVYFPADFDAMGFNLSDIT